MGEDEGEDEKWEVGEGAVCLPWSPGESFWASPKTPKLGKTLAEVGKASTPSSLYSGSMSNTMSVYTGGHDREHTLSTSAMIEKVQAYSLDFYYM